MAKKGGPVTVELEGFKALDLALMDLVDDIGSKKGRTVLRTTLRKALTPIAVKAKELAPRNKAGTYPFLAESITVAGLLTKSQKAMNLKPSTLEVYAGPSQNGYPEALHQEFGTFKHPPQPYMTPAWEGGKGQVLEDVKVGLGDQIMKAAKAAERRRARVKG